MCIGFKLMIDNEGPGVVFDHLPITTDGESSLTRVAEMPLVQ
jgi:hypothetical protein